MNTLPVITEDQYMVLEYIPGHIGTKRERSQYEPSLEYNFKSPDPRKSRAYKKDYSGSKKTIVMTLDEIVDVRNPQQVYYQDALYLTDFIIGGKSIYRIYVEDKEVVEKVIEEIVVDEPIKTPIEIVEEDGFATVPDDVKKSIAKMKKYLAENDVSDDVLAELRSEEKAGKDRAKMLALFE